MSCTQRCSSRRWSVASTSRRGRLRIANAGHEPPLLVPADGGPIVDDGGRRADARHVLAAGPPETEIELAHGDRLLLYTDGVTDALTSTGERFGKDRLIATLEDGAGRVAHDLVRALSRPSAGSARA